VIGLHSVPRPLTPDDADRLVRMFARLSRETVYRRFFTLMPALEGSILKALTTVDHDRHEALVVTVGDEIVALASYHRSAHDPSVADVAVLVEDAWQHHGVGRRLVRRLARLAAERGIERFHADVLADNRNALGMIRRMSRDTRGRLDEGAMAFDLPLVAAAA
jgi:GNAT superfamily N-acetyltransferase